MPIAKKDVSTFLKRKKQISHRNLFSLLDTAIPYVDSSLWVARRRELEGTHSHLLTWWVFLLKPRGKRNVPIANICTAFMVTLSLSGAWSISVFQVDYKFQ